MADLRPDDVEPTLTAAALRVIVASVNRALPSDPEAFGAVAASINDLPSGADDETVWANWMALCDQLWTIPIDDLTTVFKSLPSGEGADEAAASHWFIWGVYDQRIVAEVDDQSAWVPNPRVLPTS